MRPATVVETTLIAALSLILLGCAPDDPIVIETVTQEVEVTPEVAADPEVELDCRGSPLPDPAAFPPAPEADIARPADDKVVDLRGQARVEIEIRDNVFEARRFRVDPCTEIVFVNRGANPHNVVPAAEGAFPKIEQNALTAAPQALVVTAPGDYPFYCSIHGTPTRGQTGYLIVGNG